jgi:hypothetical protein
MTAAQTLADTELQGAEALVRAETAAATPRDAITSIGLIGESPDTELAAARLAFQAGAADAAQRAELVAAAIAAAPAAGRSRLIGGIGTLVVIGLLVTLALVLVRRRRAALRLAQAHPAGDWLAARPGPYATLADQSTEPAELAPPTSESPVPDLATHEPKESDRP